MESRVELLNKNASLGSTNECNAKKTLAYKDNSMRKNLLENKN